MPRQSKSPSLSRDLLMLGDLYLSLAWIGYQRLRHGPLWPWEGAARTPSTGPVALLVRPRSEDGEDADDLRSGNAA